MKRKKALVRQGDVLLVPCAKPKGFDDGQVINSDEGRVVLAHGEATGHAHTIMAAHVIARSVVGMMYLRVLQRAKLLHEEHKSIDVGPGFFRVIRQSEYTPEEIRRVAD